MPKGTHQKACFFNGRAPKDPFNPNEYWVVPPHRPDPIPFCEGYSEGRKSCRSKSFSNPRGGPAASKTHTGENEEEWGEDEDERWTTAAESNLSRNQTCRRKLNFALAGNPKKSADYILETGLRVTEIGGWEEKRPTESIPMMTLKRTEPNYHPRYELRKNGFYFVRLHDITDPSNFNMEFPIDPPQDGCATWDESLQKFYSDPVTVEKYKMRTLKPLIGKQYAYYNEELKKWERIRVHQTFYYGQVVFAVFMDRLATDYIMFKSLVELHSRFANWHRYPVRGGLKDIVPWHDPSLPFDPNQPGPWSPEAIEYFKEYANGKLFQVMVVSNVHDRKDFLCHASDETRFVRLGVLLFEVCAKPDIPVNAILIQKGYASPIKGMNAWDTMIECFHGLKIYNQGKDPSDPATKK